MSKKTIDTATIQSVVADLQNKPFDGAKQAVEVARFILTGETPSTDDEDVLAGAGQATCVPSSDTVQKPAAE